MSSRKVTTVGEHRLPARHPLRVLQAVAAIAGVSGLAASLYAYARLPQTFYHAYLVAFLFWLGFALGPIGILGLQYVTGGRWGVVTRRPLEAAAGTLPLMAILFVPVVLGMHDLYVWTHADVVAHDALLQTKVGYLNERFFLARAAVYFGVWIALGFALCRLSRRQDEEPGDAIERKLQFLGRGTLVLYALTMTFAAVDWAMSLDPHWYSHIYGIRMIGGQILTAFAFTIVVTVVLAHTGAFGPSVGPARLHDLGNLMLAFVMVWAYFELSQFLIIWAADLPEETPFYVRRLAGAWNFYSIALVVCHFVVPFVVLLSRPVKRNPSTLGVVALWVLLARAADVYWQIVPSMDDGAMAPYWVLCAAMLGMGGIWLALYVRQLSAYPLLPINDTTLLAED